MRFAPDGELFVSGGFDGKMFLYKAGDYSKVGEFGSPAHGGGIYAVSYIFLSFVSEYNAVLFHLKVNLVKSICNKKMILPQK